MSFLETDFMLNPNGKTYHLNITSADIANTIILVGDPQRVARVSQHFDTITLQSVSREFVVHTGQIKGKCISVISTGISSANIDIAMNELDLLVNMDLQRKKAKERLTRLDIIRLGTCGVIQEDLAVDSLILSSTAFSFDGLLNYYQHHYHQGEKLLLNHLKKHFHRFPLHHNLYLGQAHPELFKHFNDFCISGITMTCGGFYGPQYRKLRAALLERNIVYDARAFHFSEERIINLEMETAAIYGLGKILGHRCCSISLAVANRITGEKSTDPHSAIEKMITQVLDRITTNNLLD